MSDILEGTENGYQEVTLIVDGAVDETRIFGALGGALPGEPEESFDDWLTQVGKDYETNALGSLWEVYVLDHGHPLDYDDDGEDTCVQYVTDAHPFRTFGG